MLVKWIFSCAFTLLASELAHGSYPQNSQPRSLGYAGSPTVIEASYETDPIPYGENETDDATIWYHHTNPHLSLILGTSKFESTTEGYGGLGVYHLDGKEKTFLPGDRLNNIDIPLGDCLTRGCSGDRAIASNRTIFGLSIFDISQSRIQKILDREIRNENGDLVKVYGLCSATVKGQGDIVRTLVLLPTKSGMTYIYEIKNLYGEPDQISLDKYDAIDLRSLITPEQDQIIKDIVEKSARAEGELDDLDKKLKERFALEGCAYDHHRNRWLIAMENFGIWSVPEKSYGSETPPQILIQVQGSWSDIQQWGGYPLSMRITDDIEGIDVFTYDQNDFAIFSIQGISEYGLFNLTNNSFVGQFAIRFSQTDPVSNTDGIAVKSSYLGTEFPKGIAIFHDDKNESIAGQIDLANYKIVNLERIMSLFQKNK